MRGSVLGGDHTQGLWEVADLDQESHDGWHYKGTSCWGEWTLPPAICLLEFEARVQWLWGPK
jgi:hypothetical protein